MTPPASRLLLAGRVVTCDPARTARMVDTMPPPEAAIAS